MVVETISSDFSILKVETFDIEFARQLVDDEFLAREEKDKLRRFIKNSIKNTHETHYKLGKHLKNDLLGRLCAVRGEGLQTFQKDVRAAIAHDYYWDLDMVNAQPTLLKQYAERNGWKCSAIEHYITNREELLTEVCDALQVERWEAKDRVIALFFGSSYVEGLPAFFTNDLKSELHLIMKNNWELNKAQLKFLERKPNHYGKALADILQTEERNCLMALESILVKYGRSMDVYIHDGGLVRKLKDELVFPPKLITLLEDGVFEKTGYKIKLHIKPLTTKFSKKIETDSILSSSILIDDAFAAREFAKAMGDHIVYDSGVVWVFDSSNGIWSSNEGHIRRVITNCCHKLIFKQMGNTGIKIYNYSGVVHNTTNLMIKLPDVLPKQDGWFHSKSHSDIGKLLFPNGIYTFATGEFQEGFDSNIVFFNAMPRKFPVRNQEHIDFIYKKCFEEAFAEEGNRNALIHELMCALSGHYIRKKFVIGTGFGNSGKGMLIQLVRNSFGMYASSFNGDSLLMKRGDGESSRELGWISNIAHSRISFGSEITMKSDHSINGNLIKSIASGGDEIKVRALYQNEKSVICKAVPFMFAQEIPQISPVDSAILNRLVSVEWSFSYVSEPTRGYEKQADPTLATKLNTPELGDAFFWFIADVYLEWSRKQFAEPKMSEIVLHNRETLLDRIDYEEVLSSTYEITHNEEDFVPIKELLLFFKNAGIHDSATKIGREITALGLIRKKIKVEKKSIDVRLGIRKL